MAPPDDDLLLEQIAYYDAHAGEYDRMLERAGRYNATSVDPPLDPLWADADGQDLERARVALEALIPGKDVLEIACGTGWWTAQLASLARSVSAVDSSPGMLAIAKQRITASNVSFLQTSIFDWEPYPRYDLVFFAFWLSHVPPDLFDSFWAKVARCLKAGGSAFFVDEVITSDADRYEERTGDERGTTIRTLEDGRQFRMVKVYYTPEEIEVRLGGLGWSSPIVSGRRIYHGIAARVSKDGPYRAGTESDSPA